MAGFWLAVVVAAELNPGYAQRRDYVSALAARGAEHSWLGMAAIAAVGGGMVAAALLVARVSRVAAAVVAAAGAGFVVVALVPLRCANGAARCGIGGRFDVSGAGEVTHWTATTVSSILLIAGIALTGLALLRRRRTAAGVASLLAAAVTTGALLATGGDSPGAVQRAGIVVATGWLAAVAVAALTRAARPGRPP